MGQQLRIEEPGRRSLITTRTRNSELWFVNNHKAEGTYLGQIAKYQERYTVKLYAAVFQGNHYHLVTEFSAPNRAWFMRDLNSMIAKLCGRHTTNYPGGTLWARRYAEQALPNKEDVEEYLFYCALQPVLAGLCEKIEDYPGYNSFNDAVSGRSRVFEVVDWAGYNQRKRFDSKARIKDFSRSYTLQYSRLPGYEHLSQEEYREVMYKKLEERRQRIVEERRAKGLGFAGRVALSRVVPGSQPKITKKSSRGSFRPLVLTKCRETKRAFLSWFFGVREAYIRASRRFRSGELSVSFPTGTYRPLTFVLTG